MDWGKKRQPVGDGEHGPGLAPMMMRRKSKAVVMGQQQMNTFDAVAGIQFKMGRRLSLMRRPSVAPSSKTDQSLWPATKLENNYRTSPHEKERFNAPAVEKVTKSILESFLCGEKYDASKCSRLTQQLCEVIKARVREMNIPRYKVVCYVLIGQDLDQCINHSSRCVWDTETDNYASTTYKNGSLFAVATVYGMYYE